MPESTLDVIIRNSTTGTAAVAEEKAAMSDLGGVTAQTSEKTKGHAAATKEAAEAERDLTKEGGEAARAMGELGAKGGEVFERFSALAGVMGSGGGLGLALGAALVGVGALIEGAHKVNEAYEEQVHSAANLKQATDATHQSYEELNKQFEDFVAANAQYVSNENDARDVLASFVRAGFDANESMKALNATIDLAGLKNEDLNTAGNQVLLMMEGQGRVAKQLGIDITALKNSTDNAAKSQKDLETANKAVATAQDKLVTALRMQKEEEDALHGKRVLSQHDLDILLDKANAVKKAQDDLTTATQNQKKAQDDASGAMQTSAQVLDQLTVKTDKGRDSLTDLQKQQNQLNHDWDTFAHATGPVVEAVWEGILGTLDGVLQLLLDIPAAAQAAGDALARVQGPGSGHPGGIDVPRGPSVTRPAQPGSGGGGAGGSVGSDVMAGQVNNFYIQAQDPASTAQAVLAAMATAT